MNIFKHKYIILALVLVIIIILITAPRRENFDLGSVFKKIGQIGKSVGNTVANAGKGAINAVVPKGYKAEYVNREPYSFGWACPPGSVDYGREDKQCLVSEYGEEIWRDTGNGTWAWSCPRGTTPNNSNDGQKKCVKGFSPATEINGVWKCHDSDTITGKNWDNSDWFTAQQQCASSGMGTVYAYREKIGGVWKCPPNTKDTGLTWGASENGRDMGPAHCQKIGG